MSSCSTVITSWLCKAAFVWVSILEQLWIPRWLESPFCQVTNLYARGMGSMWDWLRLLTAAKGWARSCRTALKCPRRLGVQPGTGGCLASVRPLAFVLKAGTEGPTEPCWFGWWVQDLTWHPAPGFCPWSSGPPRLSDFELWRAEGETVGG